jgi:hypothetical protein
VSRNGSLAQQHPEVADAADCHSHHCGVGGHRAHGGATMSNLAPIASHRTPSGTGVRASRCKSGELLERPDDCPKRCEMRPRRTPERGAKGDDGVLAGEATAAMAYAPNGGK